MATAMDIIIREKQNMNKNEELNKIDITSMLGVFFKTIKKFWLRMVAVTVILAIVFYIHAALSFEPMYQSQATFSVNTDGNSMISGGSVGDEQVKESLPYILQSDVMKNMVKEELELDTFPATMELESKESANFYILKVTAQDAGMAYAILQSVMKHIPDVSVYVLGKLQVELLDDSGIAARASNYLDKRMSFATGVVLGLAVCFAFAVIYTVTSHTIQKEEDFKKYLSVSCIAAVPKITFKKRRKQIDKHIHIHNDKVGYSFHESMRTLRARVQRIAEKQGYKVLMVTSSVPSEGKSTIAVNLALSLAESGKKVVLVDMDLRNPSVAKVVGMEDMKTKGVAELLEKKAELHEIVVPMKEWKLNMIFGGEEKSDPGRLLSSKRVEKMIHALKEKHDYVILDTPPAAMLADATSIGRCADCALYVVKQDFARIERIAEGMEILTFSRTPIIGALLNHAEGTFSNYGGYRYGRYGKYGNYGAYGDYAKDGNTDSEYVDVE